MAWYDIFKDAASAAQKSGNIELFQTLLEAQQQAFAIQAEKIELEKRIEKLQDKKVLAQKIKRNPKRTFVTMLDDSEQIAYCSVCWDKDEKLIQMKFFSDGVETDHYQCMICANFTFIYDEIGVSNWGGSE